MNIKIKHFFKNKSINLESLFSFILLVLIIITFFSSIILKNFGAKIDVPVIISFLSVCVSAGSFYVTNYENKRSDERKQAAAVSCWLLNSSKKDERKFINEKNKDGGFYFVPRRAIVKNTSYLPLYDVFIFSMNSKSNDDIDELCQQFNFVKYIGILPPGESIWYVKTAGSAMGGVRSRIAMIFRDSNYQWWYRGPQGKLSKIKQKSVDKLVNSTGIYYPLFDGSNYENNYDFTKQI